MRRPGGNIRRFPCFRVSKFPRFFWEGHALSSPGFALRGETPDRHPAPSACEINPPPIDWPVPCTISQRGGGEAVLLVGETIWVSHRPRFC